MNETMSGSHFVVRGRLGNENAGKVLAGPFFFVHEAESVVGDNDVIELRPGQVYQVVGGGYMIHGERDTRPETNKFLTSDSKSPNYTPELLAVAVKVIPDGVKC